jgi:hypothetical protein
MQPRFPPPRFGLSTLFVVVTLICMWLAWQFTEANKYRRRLYDEIIAHYLTQIHLAALSEQSANWTSQFDLGGKYQTSVLLPTGLFKDQTAAAAFEKQLLAQWPKTSTGATPTNEFADHGSTHYRAIRAGAACVRCHSLTSSAKVNVGTIGVVVQPKPVNVGDLIAIIKVELQ